MRTIALLIFTDGRTDLLKRTWDSAMASLFTDTASLMPFIVNDEPAVRNDINLGYAGYAHIAHAPERRGFGETIRRAWRGIAGRGDVDYIFHLEDDFVFKKPVPLDAMMTVLDERPHLAQLALRRQPWNDLEKQAGGIVELWPDDYEEHRLGEWAWLEHRLFFTTNPSLYPLATCEKGWPKGDGSEMKFAERLFLDRKLRCAYWGARDSGEWVEHIGEQRAGMGY